VGWCTEPCSRRRCETAACSSGQRCYRGQQGAAAAHAAVFLGSRTTARCSPRRQAADGWRKPRVQPQPRKRRGGTRRATGPVAAAFASFPLAVPSAVAEARQSLSSAAASAPLAVTVTLATTATWGRPAAIGPVTHARCARCCTRHSSSAAPTYDTTLFYLSCPPPLCWGEDRVSWGV
jgi:hypothetical protein